jgi:hypothetical protein
MDITKVKLNNVQDQLWNNLEIFLSITNLIFVIIVY